MENREDKGVGDVDMCVESTQCVRDLVLVLQENEGIQEKRLVEAFERMDTDKDREVDLEEWKKFIRDKGSLNDDRVMISKKMVMVMREIVVMKRKKREVMILSKKRKVMRMRMMHHHHHFLPRLL